MINQDTQPIQTAGGAYVAQDVHTEGGNFVGRDQNINIYIEQADIVRKTALYNDNFTRNSFEPESVLIPAGSFLMGCGKPPVQPQHQVHLPDFRMGKFPVTNREYETFVKASGLIVPSALGWDGQTVPLDQQAHPVCGVTFDEALAYCHWLSQASGREYTLPTEAHWEKAVRGSFTEVTSATVREWTCTLWGERLHAPDPRYARSWQDDGCNDPHANDQIRRIWRDCAKRGNQLPKSRGLPQKRLGFRVMIKIEESSDPSLITQ